MNMKKFIIAEICVVIALAVGFWLGRVTSPDSSYKHYYENADKAWLDAEKIDNPPVTLDEPDKNRLREVRAAYRAVFDNYPDSLWADDAIYRLASRLPRTDEEAFALFRRLINDYPDSEWADDSMYAIAFASYKIGEDLKKTGTLESTDAYFDRALILFNQLIAMYPGSVLEEQAQFNTAMCHYRKGDLGIALAHLDTLRIELSDSPLFYQILYVTGEIYQQQQDYESARIEYKNVVDSGDPEVAPVASFQIGLTYLLEGKHEEALAAYQKVIELYPEVGEDAHFFIARPYEGLGRYDEAIEQLETAIALYPQNGLVIRSKLDIGRLAYANKDTERAIAAYDEVANTANYDYENRRHAQYQIGYIYEQVEDIDKAIAAYEKLLTEFERLHKNPAHPSNKITEGYIQELREKAL